MDEPNKVTEQELDAPSTAPEASDTPPAPVEPAGEGPLEGGAPAPVDEPTGDAAERAQMPPSPAPAEEAAAETAPPEPEAPVDPEMSADQLDAAPSAPESAPEQADPAAAEPAEMPSEPGDLAGQIVAESEGERREEPTAEEQRGDAQPGTPPEAPVEEPAPAPAEPTAKAAETAAPPAEESTESEADKPEPKSENMDWYILKVQSNREDSIREALRRRVKIAGLDYYFGDVIIPTEKVTEVKGGKKRVVKRKLYPGYLVAHMEINDDTWFLVRETPGIGDFTGAAGQPTPMLPHEVEAILAKSEEKQEEQPKLQIGFKAGDRVKINEGTFENFEGDVEGIDEASGQVTVIINIFGRSTPVTLGYWQIEKL